MAISATVGPAQAGRLQVAKGLSMEKRMCWGALGVAGFLLLLFLLDLFTEIPFGNLSTTVDVIGIICCLILAYMAWDTVRELQ